MKLSPKAQYATVFWIVSAPMVPVVVLLLFIAVINPFFREPFFNFVDEVIHRFANWRNNLSFIKQAHDKAYLFDMLRDSN